MSTINGDALDNTLAGTDDADTMNGLGGNDTLSASLGADTLNGGTGDDILDNGFGDGTGADVLNGGDGNDTTYFFDGISAIDGGDGTDSLVVVSGGHIDGTAITSIETLRASYTVPVYGTTAQFNGFTTIVAGSSGFVVLYLTDAGTLNLAGKFQNGDGAIVKASDFGNTLNGSAGGDSFIGGDGADTLSGGDGDDLIYQKGGSDVVSGGAGNDEIHSRGAPASLDGGDGTDILYMDDGDLHLEGSALANFETLIFYPGAALYGTAAQLSSFTTIASYLNPTLSLRPTSGGTLDLTMKILSGNSVDIVASDFGNALTGGGDSDNLRGGAGTDTLNGGNGSDFITGGAGNDVMSGGNGGDTITATGGSTQIDGGADNDSIVVQGGVTQAGGGTGDDTLTGNSGNDTLSGDGGNDVIDGKGGGDVLNGGAGDDTLYFHNGITSIDGGIGTDTLILEDKDQNLSGTALVNVENLVTGFNRTVSGQAAQLNGFSHISASVGDIVYLALTTAGALHLTGKIGGAAATVTASDFGNTITGGGSGDDLYGGAGNDTLNGGAGDDRLHSLGGTDQLNGGDGNDTFYMKAGASIDGGDGIDTLIMLPSGVTHIDALSITGVENLETDDAFGSYGTVAQLNGFSHITGGSRVFLGPTDAGTLDLSARIDSGMAVFVTASAFGNTLTTGSGDDLIYGGAGHDTLNGGAGNDGIQARGDSDTLNGGAGNDSLYGEWTVGNTLNGGEGDDLLEEGAGGGLDVMNGGNGNDTYVVSDANTVITGETASSGIDLVTAYISWSLAGTWLENLTVHDIDGVAGSQNNNATGNTLANVLTGDKTNNMLDGLTGADTMVGGAGNDTYSVENVGDVVTELAGQGVDTVKTNLASYTLGTNVENLILTGSGNIGGTGNGLANSIIGNGANNSLIGGAGDDTLSGGAGDDLLNGGTGADRLIGGLGNDTYQLGLGDTIVEQANAGTDTVLSSLAAYTLGATLENLTLIGSAVTANGNGLNNIIAGNGLNNLLQGGNGNDTISGMAGNDTINGGGGADNLSGGIGDDIFLFRSVGDSAPTARDTITDMGATDKIDLRQIDADTGTAGDQAFHLVKNFGHHAAEMVLSYSPANNRTALAVDINGDAVADLVVLITGDHTDPTGWLL